MNGFINGVNIYYYLIYKKVEGALISSFYKCMKTICYTGSNAELLFDNSRETYSELFLGMIFPFIIIFFCSNLLLCFYNVFLNFSFYQVLLFASFSTGTILGWYLYKDIIETNIITYMFLSKSISYEAKYRVKHYEVYKNYINYNGQYTSILKVSLDGIYNEIFVNESEFKDAFNKGYVILEGCIRFNKFRRIIFLNRLIPVYEKTPPPKINPGRNQGLFLFRTLFIVFLQPVPKTFLFNFIFNTYRNQFCS